jgi:hypothetical protein
LLKRGLKIEEGILCVVDGSKGLIKGIKKAFGKKQLKGEAIGIRGKM